MGFNSTKKYGKRFNDKTIRNQGKREYSRKRA